MLNATAGMHGKLHSLCAPTRSLPAPTAMDGPRTTMSGNCHYARIDERRRWRKHFSPEFSLAGASPAAVEASATLSDVRPQFFFFFRSAPRRCVISGECANRVISGKGGWGQIVPCGGRKDDHDGSARRDTAIAPPRQICGCSDSISRRDIEKGFPGAAAHCHHLSSKWARRVAIYLPLLAIRQLGY